MNFGDRETDIIFIDGFHHQKRKEFDNMTNNVSEENRELTTEEIIQQFLNSLVAHGRSKNTIRNYRKFLSDMHVFFSTHIFNGEYRIKDVASLELEQYFAYLKTEKQNSCKTIYTKRTGIQSFYNYMEQMGYCTKNVPRMLGKISVEKKEREYLTIEEMTRLLQCIDHPVVYAVVATILYAGLRISEVCSLKKEDIDLQNMELFVHLGKGKKDRILPISDELGKILSEYKEQSRYNKTEYFFTTPRSNGHISHQYVNACISKYVKKAGITKHISAHNLRHSYASALATNGCSIVAIQKLLGHSSLKTTSIYTHTSKQELVNSVNTLNLKGDGEYVDAV